MVLAHGLGGRSDLPVPLWLAVYGGMAAVVFSFVALSAFWSTSRFADGTDRSGRPLPGPVQALLGSAALRAVGTAAGLLAGATLLLVAWLGPADPATNPAPTWCYVWWWVGLVPASLLLGPVVRRTSPLRTLARWCGGRTDRRPVPGRLATAAVLGGLVAFLWLELVHDRGSEPRTVAVFLSVYGLVHVAAGAWFGPSWFARAESFEVYSTLLGHVACVDRRPDGAWVLRNPFRGLAALRPETPLVAVTCVLLGSTAFDGLSRTSLWTDLTVNTSRSTYLLSGTVGLLGSIAVVLGLYAGAVRLTHPYAPSVGPLSARFVHSLVPIVCGYTIAHYFSFAVFQGQAGWLLAGDPLGLGWDLFGLAGGRIDYTVVSTQTIAVVQVSAIVLGHVAGVVAAHDRAVELFPRPAARSGQYPLLAVIVGFTMAGIALVVGS